MILVFIVVRPCIGHEAIRTTSRSNGVDRHGAKGDEDVGRGSLGIGVTRVGLENKDEKP